MNGDRSALDQVMREQMAEADAEDAQLGLFAPPETEAGRLMAPMRRGPGRPPGARNRRTERTVSFLLGRHRDPREVLLEIAEANVADLAALYGCSRHEAAVEKRLAASAVLPYVAQRQPLAVDITQRSVVYLSIDETPPERAGEHDGIGLVAAVIDTQQYQSRSVSTPAEEP